VQTQPFARGSGGAGVVRRAVGEHVVHVHLGPGLEAAHHLVQRQAEVGQLVRARDGDGRRRGAGDQAVTLGGFSPLQSSVLSAVADRLDATPMSVALAWLLQRSPNILLIPGTSSAAHLGENVAGAGLSLSGKELAELDAIGR
jgi:diketogulonate reductase-like aldo/keto reductase